MARDDSGREGLSAGAMAKELGASPAKVKRALGELRLEPDFVRSGCAYYYSEHLPAVKKVIDKT